jgi:alkylation response protein AidB-like acyl-CoA dehydrogenase
MHGSAAAHDTQAVIDRVRALADEWARDRPQRQRRRELDAADFEQLRQTGIHLACMPAEEGGLWDGRVQSTRLICDLLRVLAGADSSVALVSAMHPAVLVTTRWLDRSTAPEPYRVAWEAQRAWAFQTVRDGAWWGTIQSEPGTGGDLSKTKTIARSVAGLTYRISGEKHFGSGSGVAHYMITSARPEGEADPDVFFMDMRGVQWDGSGGVRLSAAWDAHGMTATQSHALQFDNFAVTRLAWPSGSRQSIAAGAGGAFFAAVCVGIVEVALETARRQLAVRRASMGAFEQVEWARAQTEAWLVQQAFGGLLAALESGQDIPLTARLAKTAISELAESALGRICRVVGGGSYSRHSPFGYWFEDVRALGFLRPPWGLAYGSLFDLSWGGTSTNGVHR